jgi:hypothetical protein
MKELFTDFSAMKEFAKKGGLRFQDALIEYFRQVGEKQGFTVSKDSSVIANAHDFGKMPLVWVEPNVVFCHEFGLLDDVYRHLWRILVLQPAVAVLILSGNSQCSPQKVKDIVSRTPQLKAVEFVILDVTSGKAL